MREGYTRAFRWGGQEKPLWAKIQFLSRYPSEKTDPALSELREENAKQLQGALDGDPHYMWDGGGTPGDCGLLYEDGVIGHKTRLPVPPRSHNKTPAHNSSVACGFHS